ncbi:MAG: hypothetical protein WBZ36_12215 [Candidatus Nitrosopolaris sp.]
MTTIIDTIPKEMEVRDSLIFILNHTDNLWPRTISTLDTRGAQILVNSLEEVMKWFKASNFIDCRINAYAKYTDYYINRTGIAPTVLLVDIDREHFKTIEDFELAVTNTYNNFYTRLGSRPTQLWTGGGAHFLTPQRAPVFEKLPRFEKFKAEEPSRKFMQFEERLFSNDKADQSHWSSVSFNNCMLRIPGSLNYSCFKLDDRGKIIDIPYEAKVRIVQKWDGNIPIVNNLLVMEYYNYPQTIAIKNILEQKAREQNRKCYGRAIDIIDFHNYGYIDRLYDKPIGDFRGFCIWRPQCCDHV